eukprot:jgi/Ulvmu1/194/UM001_0198.1
MRPTEVKMVHLLAAVMATMAMTFCLLQVSVFKRFDSRAVTVHAHQRLMKLSPGASHRRSTLDRSDTRARGSSQAKSARQGQSLRASQDIRDIPISTRPSKQRRRVAVAFYGLTRSLKYTIDSIKENIFEKLTAAGYDFHVYLHTYNLTRLARSRTGDATLLNTTEWRLLDADFYKVSRQEAFLEDYKLPIAACKMFSLDNVSSASSEDYYHDQFQSIDNLLCQLNSLQEVTSMWRSSGHDYHAVLYLRPDILYNCPFPTAALDSLQPGAVHIADFHHWNGYNDRFAMGRPDTVGLWGDRLNYALATCMRQQLHAETLVSDLLQHFHLRAEMLPFSFFRVRAHGDLEQRDYNPKWKKHQVKACDKAQLAPFVARTPQLANVLHPAAHRFS